MKNAKFYRISNLFGSGFHNFWLRFRNQIIIFLILFIISFVLGIVVASKFGDSLEFERLANQKFFQLISLELDIWSYFLINLIFLCIGLVLGFLLSSNIIVISINFLFIFIIGYVLGFDTVVCLINFNFISRIFFIIFYVLLNIILNALICLIFAIGFKKYLIVKKFGKYCPLNNGFKNYLIVISLIYIILLLIECLCFNFIHFLYIV